ncbi:MAG: Crp/Fnr family transcriptional regulator [Chloroflexota bacterium]
MTISLPPASQHLTRLKALLARIRYFDGLPPEVQERIAASAAPRHFAAGQVIYIEGEPAEMFYLLERGWIKATRMSRDGREQAMMFLEAGEIFGDIAVFSGATYPGTVVALEEVDVWAIPAQEFLALTEQYPALAMAVIHHLSGRVLHYISLVEDLSLRNVEARLANTLLQHAEARDGQLIVPRRGWATFDEMAVRLGTVRDVLSRALKSMEADELLKVEKQAIVLLDPKGLAERGKL